MRGLFSLVAVAFGLCTVRAQGAEIAADFLVVGGDESGCAAAVQAARLGVKRIVLVNDVDWLGGQFCTQGIGPVDEWTIVDGKRTEFPASGAFQEILERIQAHNLKTYGIAQPGNGWCGRNTIEPIAAAQIFEEWLAPYRDQITIYGGWEPVRVLREGDRVLGVEFASIDPAKADRTTLTVKASVTADASDWGDVIRLSGAAYLAGPDLRSRFGEPSAPERLDAGGHQEMNPISWCPLLRETDQPVPIVRPARYDAVSFADWKKATVWTDWDGSGGIYSPVGWSIYTHRRMVDRYHHQLAPGTEALVLNWPAQDYPLSNLPRHVVEQLEAIRLGASQDNIVAMSSAERRVIFEDAKQRALEFVYWLQNDAQPTRSGPPQDFRHFQLAKDYGTPDSLPPKPYIREGLRLEALYIMREQDVRTESEHPLWAKSMVPDGVFGYQFNMDFHPTRRQIVGGEGSEAWQPKFFGARNWNAHSDRAMVPIRALIPVRSEGLLGCSKNIGVTSMVQSSLRLHGQMMHVGTAVGTVAALSLRDGSSARALVESPERIREVQRRLVRGAAGPGTLLWPWHDVAPGEPHFEAANILTVTGIWRADPDRVTFDAGKTVTHAELAGALVRLVRATEERAWPELTASTAQGAWTEVFAKWSQVEGSVVSDDPVTWGMLDTWLKALKLPSFPALANSQSKKFVLNRAECVDFLDRVLRLRGEKFPAPRTWLEPEADEDGDGRGNLDDALPFDRDNNNVPDRFEIKWATD